MWWIILIIVLSLIVVLVIAFGLAKYIHNSGDYGDGGGIYVGCENKVSFFAPENDKAGNYGERLVNYHLRPLLRADEYLLSNVILRTSNGLKTEVDTILISRKGIFCVETKKWIGHICGGDEDEEWIQKYDDPYRANKRHKNPVRQCLNHCSLLNKLLDKKYNIKGAVIFVELEDGLGINSNHVYTIKDFKRHYRSLPNNKIKQTEIASIYQKISTFIATAEELKAYKEEIRQKYN